MLRVLLIVAPGLLFVVLVIVLLAVNVRFPAFVMLLPVMLMFPTSSAVLSTGIVTPVATRSRVFVLSVPPMFMFD